LQKNNHQVQGVNGPDTSKDSIEAVWNSVEHGTRLCTMDGAFFIDYFVSEGEGKVGERIGRLGEELLGTGQNSYCSLWQQGAAARKKKALFDLHTMLRHIGLLP
jgi:hypothetical protein